MEHYKGRFTDEDGNQVPEMYYASELFFVDKQMRADLDNKED